MAEDRAVYDAGEAEPLYETTEARIAAFLALPQYAASFPRLDAAQIAGVVGPLVPPNAPDELILREIGHAMAAGELVPGVPR